MTIHPTIVTSNVTCFRQYLDMLVIHVLNEEKRCGGRSMKTFTETMTAKSNIFYQLSRKPFRAVPEHEMPSVRQQLHGLSKSETTAKPLNERASC